METIFRERLLAIADHLEGGRLGHLEFSFAYFNNLREGFDDEFSENGCGTVGCAMGEFPIIFPEDWKFVKNDYYNAHYCHIPYWMVLRKYQSNGFQNDIEDYLGIGADEIDHLFYIMKQRPGLYGGKILDSNVSKEEVAHNIREFVKIKESISTVVLPE